MTQAVPSSICRNGVLCRLLFIELLLFLVEGNDDGCSGDLGETTFWRKSRLVLEGGHDERGETWLAVVMGA